MFCAAAAKKNCSRTNFMRRKRNDAAQCDSSVLQTKPRLSCAVVVPWKTLVYSPTPVPAGVPTHRCEWRDICIAPSCIALSENRLRNVLRCRYMQERGCERLGRHSSVALGLIGKSVRTIAGVVLSQSTVSRAHIGRDAAIQQPWQKLPIAVGRIGCDGCWLPSLPLNKTGEHVLCRDRLLAHACRRRLHTHDHATVVVDQIVVVVRQSCRCAPPWWH